MLKTMIMVKSMTDIFAKLSYSAGDESLRDADAAF